MSTAKSGEHSHTKPLSMEDIAHLDELKSAHTCRLRVLEVKAAKLGLETPASILSEIDELRKTLAEIEGKLESARLYDSISASHPSNGVISADKANQQIDVILKGDFDAFTPEVEQATIRALAALANIPPEQVKLLKVSPGSVILRLELPKDAAERLKYLHNTRNSLIMELGIDNIIQSGEIKDILNLGRDFARDGNLPRARALYQKALEISRALTQKDQESAILRRLGAIMIIDGDFQQAKQYYEQSLKISRENNRKDQESASLNGLGRVATLVDQLTQARRYYDQALKISRLINNRHNETTSLNGLGSVYALEGHLRLSRQYYEQALEISQQTGDQDQEAAILTGLGNTYVAREHSQARQYYEQALEISHHTNNQYQTRIISHNIRELSFYESDSRNRVHRYLI